MERSVIVHGNLSDPTHIVLDEPVTELQGMVEVSLRPARAAATPATPEAKDASDAFSAPTTAARQKALAAAYPEEYVVLVGDSVLVHTRDKEEAFARYDAAVEQGGEEPIVIPPGALRRTPPPVLRGRMFAGPSRGPDR
jgi:hypothetical protein